MSQPASPPPGHPALWLLGMNLAMWGGLFGVEAILELGRGSRPAPPAPQALQPALVQPGVVQPALAGPPVPVRLNPAAQARDGEAMLASPAPSSFTPVPMGFSGLADTAAQPVVPVLQGADALGGEISLASLGEPAMQPAARLERLRWQRSGNPLAALPLHWQQRLQSQPAGSAPIQRADMVRLPVAQISEREEVALLIDDSGTATGLEQPRQEAARQAIETWASQQQPAEPGQLHAVVVAAEPLPTPAGRAAAAPAAGDGGSAVGPEDGNGAPGPGH